MEAYPKEYYDKPASEQTFPEVVAVDNVLPEVVPADSNFERGNTTFAHYSPQPAYFPSSTTGLRPDAYGYSAFATGGHAGMSELPDRSTRENKSIFRTRRRRNFWIIGGVITFLVIAAIVAGVVGGVLGSREVSSDTSSSQQTSTTGPSQSSAPIGSGIGSGSRLATVNWTTDNVDYLRLYYQDASGAIMQSGWTSATNTWNVTPIAIPSDAQLPNGTQFPAATVGIKQNSPIAVSNTNNSTLSPSFIIELFFVDSKNQLRHMSTTDPEGPWTLTQRSLVEVHPETSLAAVFINSCGPLCQHRTVIMYQNPSGFLCTLDRDTYSEEFALPGGQVQLGASLAASPTFSQNGLHVYINDDGILTQRTFLADSDFEPTWFLDGPIGTSTIDPSSQLANLANGFQDPSFKFNWVYATRETQSGGVGRAVGVNHGDKVFRFGNDQSVTAATSLTQVTEDSPIAINQAGALFAIEEGSDGSRQVIRWTAGTTGSPVRKGPVNTVWDG